MAPSYRSGPGVTTPRDSLIISEGRLLLLLATVLLTTEVRAAPQTVRLEVVSAWRPEGLRIVVETVWLGESRSLELRDNGVPPDKLVGDGVWSGEWTGEAVRMLPIQVFVATGEGERIEVSAAIEPITVASDRLVWALSNDPTPRARRVAAALPPRSFEMAEATGVAATLGWIGLVLAYVGWLVKRGGKPS